MSGPSLRLRGPGGAARPGGSRGSCPGGGRGARHLTRTCAHVLTHTRTQHNAPIRVHAECTHICAHTDTSTHGAHSTVHSHVHTHTCAPTNPYTHTPMPARSRGQQAKLRRDRRRGRQLSYSGDNSPSPVATAKHPGPQSRRVCEIWGHTRTVVNGLMEVETPDAWGQSPGHIPCPPSLGPPCGRKSPTGNCWPS